jgi:hypothetical protein
VSAHRSLYTVISLQTVNRATSVVSLLSRLWANVNAAVNSDLRMIENYVNELSDVYTDTICYIIDILSTQLTDTIEAIDRFIAVAWRVNATGNAPSEEEFDRINQLIVSSQQHTNADSDRTTERAET